MDKIFLHKCELVMNFNDRHEEVGNKSNTFSEK